MLTRNSCTFWYPFTNRLGAYQPKSRSTWKWRHNYSTARIAESAELWYFNKTCHWWTNIWPRLHPLSLHNNKVILDQKCPTMLALYQVPRNCIEKAKIRGKKNQNKKQNWQGCCLQVRSVLHLIWCVQLMVNRRTKKKARRTTRQEERRDKELNKSTINHHGLIRMPLVPHYIRSS